MEADFNDRCEPSTQDRAPMLKMDQIDELTRILREQGIGPEPLAGSSDVLSFPDHRDNACGVLRGWCAIIGPGKEMPAERRRHTISVGLLGHVGVKVLALPGTVRVMTSYWQPSAISLQYVHTTVLSRCAGVRNVGID